MNLRTFTQTHTPTVEQGKEAGIGGWKTPPLDFRCNKTGQHCFLHPLAFSKIEYFWLTMTRYMSDKKINSTASDHLVWLLLFD